MLPLKIEQIRMPWAGLLDESNWPGTPSAQDDAKALNRPVRDFSALSWTGARR